MGRACWQLGRARNAAASQAVSFLEQLWLLFPLVGQTAASPHVRRPDGGSDGASKWPSNQISGAREWPVTCPTTCWLRRRGVVWRSGSSSNRRRPSQACVTSPSTSTLLPRQRFPGASTPYSFLLLFSGFFSTLLPWPPRLRRFSTRRRSRLPHPRPGRRPLPRDPIRSLSSPTTPRSSLIGGLGQTSPHLLNEVDERKTRDGNHGGGETLEVPQARVA